MEVYKREVERKYVLRGVTYDKAEHVLSNLIGDPLYQGSSFDEYWKAPHVDFIRVRENSKELTVKVTDRGSVTNRIEENVKIHPDDMGAIRKVVTLLHGPSCLKLDKQFAVYEMEFVPATGTGFKAILCLYQIAEDPESRVFFEIEAETLALVDAVAEQFPMLFVGEQEARSLFQIFMGGK